MQKQLQLLRDLQELDTERMVVENEQQTGHKEQQELKAELDRLQEMVDSLAEEISVVESEKKELVNAMSLEQEKILNVPKAGCRKSRHRKNMLLF